MARRQAVRREEASAVPAGEIEVSRPAAGVLLVTLARPERRNSLSQAMLTALQEAIDAAERERGVRCVVIAARGPAFCAGHDLKELTAHRSDADGGAAFTQALMARCSAFMQSIVRCPKPVIAAVQGIASAAGCQLVATCDLAVASAAASFCTPGVNIGLFCSTPMVALSRNVPRKRAMEMLLTGEVLGAREAAEYGLVNRVVAPERLAEETLALAQLVASKPAHTVALGKAAFYRQLEAGLTEAYDLASQVMCRNMLHEEAREGIGAFLDKRPPDWSKT